MKLVETTWLSRYLIPTEITYDRGSEFIVHGFRIPPIDTKYRITTKPIISVNPMSNAILERIHQVLGNLVHNFNIQKTYVDENDQWADILAAEAFAISSTTNWQKGYSPGQLIFCRDMILPI